MENILFVSQNNGKQESVSKNLGHQNLKAIIMSIIKESIITHLEKSKEILDNMVFSSKHDAEFPIEVDKKDLAKLKSLIIRIELLLNDDRVHTHTEQSEV